MRVYSKVFKGVLGLSVISICLQAHAVEAYGDQAKKIKISGEQVIHDIPKGWDLSYFEGDPAGNFLMEYVPKGDDVRQWKQGYLLIRRSAYPDATLMSKLKEAKISPAMVGILQAQDTAKKGCGENFRPMTQGETVFNGIAFAISGGYCPQYGQYLPFGEGAVVSVLEGKENIFKLQYSWRPHSAQPQLKWGLENSQITNYLDRIKNTHLCGGINETKCSQSSK